MQQPAEPLAASLRDALISAHNVVRATARPPPQPTLPGLVWSDDLAAIAERWAAQCKFRHNFRRGASGENLFATTVADPRAVLRDAVASWAEEAAAYDYALDACAAGKVCGHYTQVVWRATRSVGCAVQACTHGSPFGTRRWTLLVCNYRPWGNVVGERPY